MEQKKKQALCIPESFSYDINQINNLCKEIPNKDEQFWNPCPYDSINECILTVLMLMQRKNH